MVMSLYSDLICIFCFIIVAAIYKVHTGMSIGIFENLPVLPLLIKRAALGNLKVTFIALIGTAFSH